VARSKRRGDDAVDERLDDVLDEDAVTDEFDDEDEGDAGDVEKTPKSNGRTRTLSRPKPAAGGGKPTKVKETERPNIFARLINFIREVVAELRKVIWPTRKELLTYTAVVIVFVTIMFSIVAGLDVGFAKVMFWVFGGAPTQK
jgi:preprotein translocase subunit SecE